MRKPKRDDLAKEAVRRAEQAWGRTAWQRFSGREREEKVGRELLSILAGWTLPSLTPEQREVAAIARDIFGLLNGDEESPRLAPEVAASYIAALEAR